LAALLLVPLLLWPDQDSTAGATSRTTYLLRSSVVGVAGSPGTSAGKRVLGTAGQPTPVGVGSAAGKVLYAGFWDRIPTTSAVEEEEIVEDFVEIYDTRLFQNIPNPFNPVTTIQYSVAQEGPVDLTIFSVEGERVRTLVHDYHYPGLFSAVWDGRDEQGETVSSGVYFYRMTAGEYSDVRKMLILK
jgi:hypothetical protein